MDNAQQLAALIFSYIASRRDKKVESFYKDKPKKNKQGIVTNGAINIRLASMVSATVPDQKDAVKNIEKSKKEKTQTPLVFQEDKYQQLLSLLPEPITDDEILALKDELDRFLIDLENEFNPITWLNEWTSKASDISFASHVAKLTHSSSKSSSILDLTTQSSPRYLTTNSLQSPEIDTASSNAASLPIADILKLSVNDVSVLECIKSGETDFLKHITDDDKTINTWCKVLKQAYDSTQKSSYFLNKQVYFPVGDNRYHLLLPLTSSSLVQAIHREHQKYFTDEAKEDRKLRKNQKYSANEVRSYPNKAVIHVTGSNHSNASALNGQRGGRVKLFPALPPQWQSRNRSIARKTSLFDEQLSYRLKNQIDDLKNYLHVLKKQQLSISKPDRNGAVVGKLTAISDEFFNYILEIQLQEVAGWTIDSDLPVEQQMLLEPNREDEAAKVAKLAKDWLTMLSQSYARWLNKQLNNKQLGLTKIQAQLWREHFIFELKYYLAAATTNDTEEVSL